MIKVTYKTIGGDMKKPEETTVLISNGQTIVKYNIPNKAQTVVEQMHKDGRKGVLYSRGCLIQLFHGKNEQEILEIVKKDIENGVLVAKAKSNVDLKIYDYEETTI